MTTSKLRDLIAEVKVAMFTTVDEEGAMRSRPLATLEVDNESELCFFTAEDAPKVDEVRHERHVNLAYSDPEHQRYISVSGSASVSQDRAAIQKRWKPLHRAWFPKGPDDPSLAMITVRVSKAEYWDAPSGTVVNVIGMAKAVLTGERYEPGDNAKFTFSR